MCIFSFLLGGKFCNCRRKFETMLFWVIYWVGPLEIKAILTRIPLPKVIELAKYPSTKHLRKNWHWLFWNFYKNRWGGNHFKFILQGQHCPDTKTKQECYNKRTLQVNILNEHKCRYQNISKPNSAVHLKKIIHCYNRIYPGMQVWLYTCISVMYNINKMEGKNNMVGTSRMVQWLRSCPAMRGLRFALQPGN